MRTPSPIHCELNLIANGRHCGYLRLPHSVHRSAYGWLPIPLVSIRNGEGPRVLLMAGNHGDEYEGQIALSNMAQWLNPDAIRGQVLILPMANYPAALAGLRTSPIDDGNLNRSFPGDPSAGPTKTIAHYIESVLMQGIDLVLDVHSGGSSLNYIPSVLADLDEHGQLQPQTRMIAEAFAAPLTLLHSQSNEQYFSVSAARRSGALGFTTELGGAGTVTPRTLRFAEQGLVRALEAIGVLVDPPAWREPAPPTRYLHVDPSVHFVYARDGGLFEPRVALGDEVQRGGLAALIHHPESPLKPADAVHFDGDGVVVCQRIPARCERGDCLFHLGGVWSET